jgi:hypothetical protein
MVPSPRSPRIDPASATLDRTIPFRSAKDMHT